MKIEAAFLMAAALLSGCTLPVSARPRLAPGAHYAKVRGLRMYYEVRGHGPALLLLHGGGESVRTSFSKQLPTFSKHYTVIAPEQMGQGHTADTARPLSYSEMTEDTAALLRQLGVRHCDIVGWSDGGILGLMLAIRYPKMVGKLVASGANFRPDGLTPATTRWLQTVQPRDWWGAGRKDYEKVSPDGARHWSILVGKLKTLWLEYPSAEELNEKNMAAIKAPTLIIAGDHDVIRTEHTVEIANTIHNAQLFILPDTPHETFSQRPALMNRVLLNFLKQKKRK